MGSFCCKYMILSNLIEPPPLGHIEITWLHESKLYMLPPTHTTLHIQFLRSISPDTSYSIYIALVLSSKGIRSSETNNSNILLGYTRLSLIAHFDFPAIDNASLFDTSYCAGFRFAEHPCRTYPREWLYYAG